NYLKGETPPPFDLLHWNGDSANLPGPMYAYYLREMYLHNRLCEPGALTMLGESIDLGNIELPSYVVATHDDHIVPWRSAYKTTTLLPEARTFVLGASGHIAGVVNPVEGGKRNHWVGTQPRGRMSDNADAWLAGARSVPGSWWTNWAAWLSPLAGRRRKAPAVPGNAKFSAIMPAPGSYVIEEAQ
ncbi:MAG TPA: alpha/beta fold hydrolase, partial [Casimicrobiaceae bacterium]|nr:alpha/beta fold hydrolase [Casimicrobiaceae bacterium]